MSERMQVVMIAVGFPVGLVALSFAVGAVMSQLVGL